MPSLHVRLGNASAAYVDREAGRLGKAKAAIIDAVLAEAARRGWRVSDTLAVRPKEGDDD